MNKDENELLEWGFILKAVAIISGATIKPQPKEDPQLVLLHRSRALYRLRYPNSELNAFNPSDIYERATQEACWILECAQDTLMDKYTKKQELPLIGARDASYFKAVVDHACNALISLVNRISASWPTISKGPPKATEVIDLTCDPEHIETAASVLRALLRVIFPFKDDRNRYVQSFINKSMIMLRGQDIVLAAIAIGWLPQTQLPSATTSYKDIRTMCIRLLEIMPRETTFMRLGNILLGTRFRHVQRACQFLMSQELMRPDGLKGFFGSVLGPPDDNQTYLNKFEYIVRHLNALPSTMKPEQYYPIIVPRILAMLLPTANSEDPAKTEVPALHVRTAAFFVSKSLIGAEYKKSGDILLNLLHAPFNPKLSVESFPEWKAISVTENLSVLSKILLNTDPSPPFFSALFSPIAARLYTLTEYFRRSRTSDPAHLKHAESMFITWAKIVDSEEGREVIWSIIRGEGGDWEFGDESESELTWVPSSSKTQASLLDGISAAHDPNLADPDINSNPLDLRPDPFQLVQALKQIGRAEISSQLFIRLLEHYQEAEQSEEGDPLKALLYLQLITQMQAQMTGPTAKENILAKPENILSFIIHVLQANIEKKPPSNPVAPTANGLSLNSLRIVDDEPDGEVVDQEGDSDDEGSGEEGESTGNMVSTAISLLLSVLEANLGLSSANTPQLDIIWNLLEPLSGTDDEQLRPLVREARVVMTARLASSSASAKPKKKGGRSVPTEPSEDAEEKAKAKEQYLHALKLLQDPILPVRAHGLLLLRQLVAPPVPLTRSTSDPVKKPLLEPALVPGILSVFLESLQDGDSYIFLNAVQGLSAMVEGYGKDVLKSLIDMYTKGLLNGPSPPETQWELDIRLRVGEALIQVITRDGEAAKHYNILLPPLLAITRADHAPTILRISALSIVAHYARTAFLPMMPYILETFSGLLNMLQLLAVPSKAPVPERKFAAITPNSGTVGDAPVEEAPSVQAPLEPSVNLTPTSTDPKLPEFRRAGLHLLLMISRAITLQIYADSGGVTGMGTPVKLLVVKEPSKRAQATAFVNKILSRDVLKNGITVTGYIAQTSDDGVARSMAHESCESMKVLLQYVQE
ncbi:hypothetical protein SISSUDRAFT_1049524 [Sistotremastrum suecicum HHB10207 ss-3]|uniref:RNA polymerase II assembly factor Rtp1 C-terminal domain-containing protein n=1 Tax=Sistotremastrum suecicum HHB10207 ss-3 TaxID=1314776 RepID=A0A166BS67_9AGAM|nr:hypothetical protein SISSUDRAFT_1049524 [Sistotremastrum suecicum HHB10207 ss-3]